MKHKFRLFECGLYYCKTCPDEPGFTVGMLDGLILICVKWKIVIYYLLFIVNRQVFP